MWKNPPPCRDDLRCPLARIRWGYTVFLMFSLRPGGEKLPFYSGRVMPLDVAERIVDDEIDSAKRDHASAMTVALRGGNPLERPEELLALAGYIEEKRGAEHVQIQMVFWSEPEQLLPFLKAHGRQYRKVASILKPQVLCKRLDENVKLLAPEFDIHYTVAPETVDTFYGDVLWLADHAQRFRLKWQGKNDMQAQKQYFRQLRELYADSRISDDKKTWFTDGYELELLARLRLGGPFPSTSSGKCYDTTGWAWPCPCLSSLNLLTREMDDRSLTDAYAGENDCPDLVWMCPGKLLAQGEKGLSYQSMKATERMKLAYYQGALLRSKLPQPQLNTAEGAEQSDFERETVKVLANMILEVQETTINDPKG